MTVFRTQTDRDWSAQHRIQESLRHERLERQASLVCLIETTAANEPVPRMTMQRYRRDQLNRQVQEIKSRLDIMSNEEDHIQGL